MKNITWNLLKSERLKRTRGMSFEDILNCEFVAVKRHPEKGHQNIIFFKHKKYIWVVPYVENDKEMFLKTLYPSRKYTKAYREGLLNEKD